jgi:Zn ribbon nucleic-acid-binding protein
MTQEGVKEFCVCPFCKNDDASPWAEENGFVAVRCKICNFLYVNPRPSAKLRNRATQLGVHKAAEGMVLPGPLDLPDHVVFGGQAHVTGFLKRHGFEIVSVQTERIDGALYTAKNIVKKLLGRNVRLALPHQSPYRTMLVRARKLHLQIKLQ